jgi:hypothetical protein
MSTRTKCADCGSSDGLATYDNGTYCFSCCKKTVTKQLNILKEDIPFGVGSRQSYEAILNENNRIWDFNEFPIESQEYLLKYFTKDNIPLCFYNNIYKRLFFPCYQQIAYWGRSIDEEKHMSQYSRPKWLYVGDHKNSYSWVEYCIQSHLGRNRNTAICIAEDVISAIKISEIMDCICLGGTSLSEADKLKVLEYKQLFIFLDPDEAGRKAAEKVRNSLKLHVPIHIVRSIKDPKEYSIEELKEKLDI